MSQSSDQFPVQAQKKPSPAILPTLSVVMPNYNHGRHLPRSVAAIVNQSVQPQELIILDDVSTDDSVQVIKELAARYPIIKFIQNEKNLGAAGNVNKGIQLAQGDYVVFPAADDELMPGFIEKSLSLLAQYPQAGLSCSPSSFHDLATGLSWHLGAGMSESPRYFSPAQLLEFERRKRVFIPTNTTIFHRQRMLDAGGIRPELKWHADTFLVHAIAFRHGICYNPQPLAHVNVEPRSYFQAGRKNEQAHRAICERIMELLTSPEFAEQGKLMSQAGTFYRFEGCILSVLWRNKKYRPLITWPFLRKHLWYTLQVKLKPYTPAWIGNLYLKLAGYRAR